MKRIKALLIAGALVAFAFGCSTTSEKENMLTAAGFKMIPADSPEKLAHLNSLPAGKITTVQRNGTLFFTYPDPKNKMLYVGHQQQYEDYQKLRLEKQMTEEQLTAGELNQDRW